MRGIVNGNVEKAYDLKNLKIGLDLKVIIVLLFNEKILREVRMKVGKNTDRGCYLPNIIPKRPGRPSFWNSFLHLSPGQSPGKSSKGKYGSLKFTAKK